MSMSECSILHGHVSMSVSPCPCFHAMSPSPCQCLHVHVSMSMSLFLHVAMPHVYVSMFPCLRLHVFVSMSPCFRNSSTENRTNGTATSRNAFVSLLQTKTENKSFFSFCRQTINGNRRFLFQQTCPSMVEWRCIYPKLKYTERNGANGRRRRTSLEFEHLDETRNYIWKLHFRG